MGGFETGLEFDVGGTTRSRYVERNPIGSLVQPATRASIQNPTFDIRAIDPFLACCRSRPGSANLAGRYQNDQFLNRHLLPMPHRTPGLRRACFENRMLRHFTIHREEPIHPRQVHLGEEIISDMPPIRNGADMEHEGPFRLCSGRRRSRI